MPKGEDELKETDELPEEPVLYELEVDEGEGEKSNVLRNILLGIALFALLGAAAVFYMYNRTSPRDIVPPAVPPSATETPQPTSTPEPSPSPIATASPTPMPTASPTPVPTASPTPVPTASPTPVPTASPTPVPTASPTPVPTASPTPVPTASPTPTASATPQPTATVKPTEAIQSTPTPAPTPVPRATANGTPVPGPPTMAPTVIPGAPTPGPTAPLKLAVDLNTFVSRFLETPDEAAADYIGKNVYITGILKSVTRGIIEDAQGQEFTGEMLELDTGDAPLKLIVYIAEDASTDEEIDIASKITVDGIVDSTKDGTIIIKDAQLLSVEQQ